MNPNDAMSVFLAGSVVLTLLIDKSCKLNLVKSNCFSIQASKVILFSAIEKTFQIAAKACLKLT